MKRISTRIARRLGVTVAIAAMVVPGVLGLTATAAHASSSFFQGFETNTSDWTDFYNGSVHREASGYANAGGYADGIASATGGFHARLHVDVPGGNGGNPSCAPGSSDCIGP